RGSVCHSTVRERHSATRGILQRLALIVGGLLLQHLVGLLRGTARGDVRFLVRSGGSMRVRRIAHRLSSCSVRRTYGLHGRGARGLTASGRMRILPGSPGSPPCLTVSVARGIARAPRRRSRDLWHPP